MEKYENPAFSPEERADDLLGKLSLEEKMAQTVCIYPMGLSCGAIAARCTARLAAMAWAASPAWRCAI